MTRYYSSVAKLVLTPLALAIALAPAPGWAENYFNPAFLSDDPSAVADLSTFSRNAQAAGMYRVDVYLNNTFLATRDIAFQAVKTTGKSAPTDDSGLRAITMFTLPLAPVRINSITLRRMRALAAHCWTKIILVTTYSKVIRITVLAKAAPPAWNTMGRKATPTLAITLAITAITSR